MPMPCDIDTRAHMKRIRAKGAMLGQLPARKRQAGSFRWTHTCPVSHIANVALAAEPKLGWPDGPMARRLHGHTPIMTRTRTTSSLRCPFRHRAYTRRRAARVSTPRGGRSACWQSMWA